MTANNEAQPPSEASSARETPLLPWQLNIEKLHALPTEQQELYLLTHVAELDRHLHDCSVEEISRQQDDLKSEIFKIIQLKSPSPKRVVRNGLGRCLENILEKGSRNALTLYADRFLDIIVAGKEQDSRTRHAAVLLLGILFDVAGNSLFSHLQAATSALSKSLKPAANDAGLRAAVYKALSKIVRGASAIDEDLARTIWKQARNGCSNDRAFLAQINACECLTELIKSTAYFDNQSDVDKLQTTLMKLFESSSKTTRRTAAHCLAASFSKTFRAQQSDAVVIKRSPAKTTDADEGEEARNSATAATPTQTMVLSTSIMDILRTVTALYTRPGSSNHMRAALFLCLARFIQGLSEAELEKNHNTVAGYLLLDLLSHNLVHANRYRYLITRKFIGIILDQAIAPRLGESAQLSICKYLLTILKKDGQRKHKASLASAVSSLANMIALLGGATSSLVGECRDTLLPLLEHPSFAVQIQVCIALKRLMLACPQEILTTLSSCRERLNTELNALETSASNGRRALAAANAVCSVVSSTVSNPLHGDAQTYADLMSQATSLLKSSSSSELLVSSFQVHVAWTLISGLMQLGPNFVKVHLSQLLMLWKNTLSATTKDSVRQRSLLELSYLCHIRDCALTALATLLKYNARLITAEVSRRLGLVLEASFNFLQMLPEKRTSDDPATRLSPAFQLSDYEALTRRRIYQCFSSLLIASPAGSPDLSSHSIILATAIASISSPDYTVPRFLSASIASSIGTTDDVWNAGDEFGFGIASLVRPDEYSDPVTNEQYNLWIAESGLAHEIESTVESPVCAASEYDASCCYSKDPNSCYPAATEAVDMAIKSFALSLPMQVAKVQQSMIEQMSNALTSSALTKDPGRRTAVVVNTALAMYSALKVVSSPMPGFKYVRTGLQAEKALQGILRLLVIDREDIVRVIAGTALGMLCSISSSDFTAAQVDWATETIVNNRDPEARAGCAFALASIHAQLGSMAAGLHIRRIVSILLSLAADTHPLVHFWALESLAKVADSAGLNYAAYVNSSVGVLSQLYTSDDHNQETASLASSNMLVDQPVVTAIARVVSSLIDVLGPDLQDMQKTRDMIVTLVGLFSYETGSLVQTAALRCQEALSLFMPNYFELQPYIHTLQQALESSSTDVQTTALASLKNVMRRDAEAVINMAAPGLERRLWDFLSDGRHTAVVQSIVETWLQQTALEQPEMWINRFSQVLTRTKSQPMVAKTPITAAPDLQDDEDVAGLAANGEPSKDDAATSAQEFLPWQVRLFALRSLQSLIRMIGNDSEAHGETHSISVLQYRVGDLIRIAFSASTAGVAALRIVGLQIIEQILHLFGRTPDPDFAEAMLLEQYQAQISSALTPAFAADSSPALAAEAINVSATFISTGIVTDIERMGRILKVLVTALDGASTTVDNTTIGDIRTFSKNAQIMFRTAVFSAWAELQVSSAEQKYLEAVVSPYVPRMAPLWLEALKEYARLRYEPDISAVDAGVTNIDDTYASFNRQTLLTYYQDAWLSLVNAVASLIDQDSQVVFDALDGKSAEDGKQTVSKSTGINYRDEPVAFFFVLFGLTIEAIATYQADTDANKVSLLQALRKILRPSVAGSVIYQDAIFAEAIDMMDRMALTDSIAVQSVIVEIATDLCMSHPSSRAEGDATGETLSEDIEQLFELTRIIVLVLGDIVPGISETPGTARAKQTEEANALVHTALQALVNVADVFPAIIRTDLRDAILHVFIVMLSTGSCQSVMVPQSLPMFRRLIASMASQPLPHTDKQLANALSRLMQILNTAQEQDTEVSLACEKNVLLASALLITAAPDLLTHDQWIVQRFLTEIQASLVKTETSRVAVGCLRTLLFAGLAPRRLFGMALRIMSRDGEDRASQALMANVLTAYAGRVAQPKRADVVRIVFATIVSWAQSCGESVHNEASSRIVELSQLDAGAFREAFTMTTAEQKQLLHNLMRRKMGTNRGGDMSEQEPTIALKLNFG